jgi:single-stranded-DNA-specific exonuclease
LAYNKTTKSQLRDILASRVKSDKFTTLNQLPNPSSFKDIQKATLRVVEAIKTNEPIIIVGDYDVDGIVSTTIMVEFFAKLNIEVRWIVPNRFKHGYGLSPKIVEQIDSGLVITVDNGISAFDAALLCKEKKIDLIITDHHTVGANLPDCYAIINPKQKECTFPYKEICGAQVAWYFCASIKKELNVNINLLDFFDILSIAIIADIMPMRSLNTAIVKKGLKQITISQRPAMQILTNHLKKSSINEEDIGFGIAPLLNCAGRMDDASIAVEFLLSKDLDKSKKILEYLVNLNNTRKEEQNNIFQDSLTQINNNDKVIVVASKNWNEGIIGIVASKLTEKYNKPSFVFSINGNKAKGSARSNSNVNLYDLLNSSKETIVGFGGHKSAAGVLVDTQKLDLFRKTLNNNIDILYTKEEQQPIQTDKFFIDIQDVDYDIYSIIEEFRPYGQENKPPEFRFKDIKILKHFYLGKEQLHQKLILEHNVELLLFNNTDNFNVGTKISFVAIISLNEFRGNVTINLILKNILDDNS